MGTVQKAFGRGQGVKILIVHNRYRNPGGEDQVALSEMELLRVKGHSVVYYEKSNCEVDGLPVRGKIKILLAKIFGDPDIETELTGIIRREAPDLVHAHNIFFMIGPALFHACRKARVPLVCTLHNFRFMTVGGILFPGRQKIKALWLSLRADFFYKLIWFCVFRSRRFFQEDVSRFIMLSDFAKRKFLDLGFDAGKVVTKPNFLDFDPGARKEAGQYVLFVGGFQAYKGVELVARAAEKLPGVSFVLVGDGPCRPKIMARKLPNVDCVGQRDLETAIEAMKKSAFVVVPSLCYENFPRVIVEAFACGVPVLAVRQPPLEELIDEGETGLFFDVDRGGDLEKNISWMMGNRTDLAKMGVRARARYEARYTADRNYHELVKIYDAVLAEAGGGGGGS